MMVRLMKKDFLLSKDDILTIIFGFLMISVIISSNMGIIGYYMAAAGMIYQVVLGTTQKDKKNKVYAMLIATPYSRKAIIDSKYVTAFIVYLVVTVVYSALGFAVRMIYDFPVVTMNHIVLCFFICAVFTGIIWPMLLRFDETVIRIAGLAGILLMGLIMSSLEKKTGAELYQQFAAVVPYAGLIVLGCGIVVIGISRIVALKIIKNIEY